MKKFTLLAVVIFAVFTLSSCSSTTEDMILDFDRDLLNEENDEINTHSEMLEISNRFLIRINEIRDITLDQTVFEENVVEQNNLALESNPVDRSKLNEFDFYQLSISYNFSAAYEKFSSADSDIRNRTTYIEGETTTFGNDDMTVYMNENFVYFHEHRDAYGKEEDKYFKIKLIDDRLLYESYNITTESSRVIVQYSFMDSDSGYSYISLDENLLTETLNISSYKLDYKSETIENTFMTLQDEEQVLSNTRKYDLKNDSYIGFNVKDGEVSTKRVAHFRDFQNSFYYTAELQDDMAYLRYSVIDLEGWATISMDGLLDESGNVVDNSNYLTDDFGQEIYDGFYISKTAELPLKEDEFANATAYLTYDGEYTFDQLQKDLKLVDELIEDYYSKDELVLFGKTYETVEELKEYFYSYIPEEYKS